MRISPGLPRAVLPTLILVLLGLSTGRKARAQEVVPAAPNAPLERRVQELEETVRQLKQREDQKKQEEEAKKKQAEAQGYEVGTDFNLKTEWNSPGTGAALVDGANFVSPNGDFKVHLGGRLHADAAWFAPDNNLNNAFPNQWNDGAEFRRLRLRGDGTMYEVINWVLEVDFQTAIAGTTNHPVPTDAYLEIAKMPWIGSIDIGHFKEPFSFDDYGTPDNYVILMERSLGDNTFGRARNMGLMLYNTAFDQKVIWATGVFRSNSDNASGNAFDYGDHEYAYTSRVVFMPYYLNDGRCWFLFGPAYSHVGLNPNDRGVGVNIGTSTTGAQVATTGGANPGTARFNARMPIRVNSPFLVDTTSLVADNYDLFNLQTALVQGPFMLQAEYFHTDMHNVRRGAIAAGVPRLEDPSFDSMYVQLSCILTGEYHPIDRDRGRMNRVRPNEPFFWVNRGENEGWGFGKGAWEIAARYDYLDVQSAAFNAFPAAKRVANSGVTAITSAGIEQAVTLGLNWYLNPNARLMWNYSHAFRNVPVPSARGNVDALGMRLIYDF